jgi:hypothetical protein
MGLGRHLGRSVCSKGVGKGQFSLNFFLIFIFSNPIHTRALYR